jgi:hypothetical protein
MGNKPIQYCLLGVREPSRLVQSCPARLHRCLLPPFAAGTSWTSASTATTEIPDDHTHFNGSSRVCTPVRDLPAKRRLTPSVAPLLAGELADVVASATRQSREDPHPVLASVAYIPSNWSPDGNVSRW